MTRVPAAAVWGIRVVDGDTEAGVCAGGLLLVLAA